MRAEVSNTCISLHKGIIAHLSCILRPSLNINPEIDHPPKEQKEIDQRQQKREKKKIQSIEISYEARSQTMDLAYLGPLPVPFEFPWTTSTWSLPKRTWSQRQSPVITTHLLVNVTTADG